MYNQTSRTAYKRHEYSGPRKSLKRVRAGLRRNHDEEICSRLKVWRSEGTKKKSVKEEILIDLNSIVNQNTKPRTYSRVKPKLRLKAEPGVDPLEISWPQADPETDSFQLTAGTVPNKCLSGYRLEDLVDTNTKQPALSYSTGVEIVKEQMVDYTDICDGGDNDDDDDSDTLVESNVCRVCLALDVKMYDLEDNELRETFQNITGIEVTENSHPILERLCWECAGRLKAAEAFRNKALLSDALLQRLANTGEQIWKNDITLIKENEDYLKSAATLGIAEVFHIVDIDPDYESLPSISKKNVKKMVQNTRKDKIKLKETIVKKNKREMDIEVESIIEVPIKTEIRYDPICPNTGEENINIVPERNSRVSNNIPLREDNTINPAYSSLLTGCSRVEPKSTILDYLPITPSKIKIKKNVVKITNRDSIPRKVSKKSKEFKSHDHTYLKGDATFKNINVKVGGIGKKTSNQKLVKKTQAKGNIYTDVEYLNLEDI